MNHHCSLEIPPRISLDYVLLDKEVRFCLLNSDQPIISANKVEWSRKVGLFRQIAKSVLTQRSKKIVTKIFANFPELNWAVVIWRIFSSIKLCNFYSQNNVMYSAYWIISYARTNFESKHHFIPNFKMSLTEVRVVSP